MLNGLRHNAERQVTVNWRAELFIKFFGQTLTISILVRRKLTTQTVQKMTNFSFLLCSKSVQTTSQIRFWVRWESRGRGLRPFLSKPCRRPGHRPGGISNASSQVAITKNVGNLKNSIVKKTYKLVKKKLCIIKLLTYDERRKIVEKLVENFIN